MYTQRKMKHNVSESFVRSVEQNERGAEGIWGKEIVVKVGEIDNQPQRKIKISERGFGLKVNREDNLLSR